MSAGADRLQMAPVQSFLSHSGYAALFVLAFAEACCVPFPSEVTFGFAGVLAASGRFNLVAVIFLGTFAELVGSYLGYTIGRIGGRPLVERLGRYVLLTKKDLDRAERWLSGRGEFAVLVGRAMPILRSFTSLVAGTADMPAVRFGVFSLIGTLIYTTCLSVIGYEVGNTWHRVAHGFSIAGYVLVGLVVLVVIAFILHRLRTLRREREEAAVAVSAGSAGES
jgi:membrane protein DedA with SNARE-associated domain